ncbi:MAG: TylF/MycF/NovP-related O-methyltransferase, partial [Thermoanaerobaculia bacterium]
GRALTPAAKARFQDTLINRFRIPVHLQADEPRLRHVLRRALQRLKSRHGHDSVGDYLEFGVYQGNSLIQAHHAITEEGLDHVRLFGFDSFAGLPETAAAEGVWSNGQYRIDVDFTRQRLAEHGVEAGRTVLVPGFFAETLTEQWRRKHAVEQAGVIMIDCDLYSSAKEALDFCAPIIGREAVVLFDDWHATGEKEGEQRALAEFLDENPHFEAEAFESYSDHSKGFILRRVGAWLPGLAASLEEYTLALDWIALGQWATSVSTLAC